MSFDALKITQAQIALHGIQGKANKLPGPTSANKLAFDELVTEVVAAAFNGLIDALGAVTAAAEIGVDAKYGLTADNLQDAVEQIMLSMQAITQGSVADGSVSTAKLADDAVTGAKLAAGAVLAEHLGSDVDYAAIGLAENQVRPIYVQAAVPTSASPDGIYLVTG